MSRQSTNFNLLFHALADPYRRSFVEQLAKAPASVKQLASSADVQLPAVLKHLRVLEEGGIVTSLKLGRVRTYQISPNAFEAMSDWVDQRRSEMEMAFDRLTELMGTMPEEKDH
jgi:DNA-binding transcriptional ArsR family regulator